MEWDSYKIQVLRELDEKGITSKEFKRKYLKFTRRINTLLNMLYARNYSWERMCESKPFTQAHELLRELKEEHPDTWKHLTGAKSADLNSPPFVGDYLA